jgi:Concanavalin A-like lectin/glucanases superfamily
MYMKKLVISFLLLFAVFNAIAQESFFKGNNNYQAPPASPFQAPAIVQAGLILNLDAANPASYSGTGNTWTNLVTGNAVPSFSINSGAYVNSDGGVIRFPSSGGFAESTSGFANLTKFTVEVWIKSAGTKGDQNPLTSSNYTPCIFSEKFANGRINMVLAYNARGLTAGTSNNSYRYEGAIYSNGWKNYQIATNYGSDINNWVQISLTYDGSKLTIYRNGVSLGTSNALNIASLYASSTGYYIAHRWDQSDGVYGDYSIVNMYNRDLSLSEITTNFNAVRTRFGL